MTRTTVTFSVSLPPEMAIEIARVQRKEHRTRSELVREALRKYVQDHSPHQSADLTSQAPLASSDTNDQ